MLPPAERAQLDEFTEGTLEVEPRRKLIDAGSRSDRIFIAKAGWLIEFKTLRNGRRQILNIRLPGDIIGLECLAFRVALHSTAAVTHCTVAVLPVAAFQHMPEHPGLISAMLLAKLREEAILHEWEVNLGRRAAFPRVAHLLLELRARFHIRGLANSDVLPFPLTQNDIADCTGLTTPYVNRILQQMDERGLVHISDRTIRIPDAAVLARTAGFNSDYLER